MPAIQLVTPNIVTFAPRMETGGFSEQELFIFNTWIILGSYREGPGSWGRLEAVEYARRLLEEHPSDKKITEILTKIVSDGYHKNQHKDSISSLMTQVIADAPKGGVLIGLIQQREQQMQEQSSGGVGVTGLHGR